MQTRKEAIVSARGYLKIYHYSLSIQPRQPQKATDRIGAVFAIHSKATGETLGGLSLEDVVGFIRKRVPEAFLDEVEEKEDFYNDLYKLFQQEPKMEIATIEKAIAAIKNVLNEKE